MTELMGSALLVKLDAAIEGSVFGPVLAFKRTAQNQIAIKFEFVSTDLAIFELIVALDARHICRR
jgi:hypothetical protein